MMHDSVHIVRSIRLTSLSRLSSTAFYHDRVMMRSRAIGFSMEMVTDRCRAPALQASDPDATSPSRLENV